MTLRFRKSVRLLPGVKLNVTKHGLSSLSVGGKGLTYNIGKKGTRTTGGLPGSGLSYSDYTSYKQPAETHIDPETGEITERPASPTVPRWLSIACAALIIGAVYFLRG